MPLLPSIPFTQRVTFGSFVSTPKTGQIRISRESDGLFWNGSAWVSTETWVSTTVASSFKQHAYSLQPDDAMVNDHLSVTMRINGDVLTMHEQRIDLLEYSLKGETDAIQAAIAAVRSTDVPAILAAVSNTQSALTTLINAVQTAVTEIDADNDEVLAQIATLLANLATLQTDLDHFEATFQPGTQLTFG